MPTAAHPACPPPCLPSGQLGPPAPSPGTFRSHGILLAESPRWSPVSGQPWPHLEEVWQSPGLPTPQPPASELQLISTRHRLGLQEPVGSRLTAPSPGVGEGARGTGHCLCQFQKLHHSRPQSATSLAPRAGSSLLQTPAFLHEVPTLCPRDGRRHPPRQTPKPGRGLHTCDRPFVPMLLGHPPAQTGRCGWPCAAVSGVSDQEI